MNNGRNRKEWIMYGLAIVGVLVLVSVTYRLLTAGLQSYVALFAGVMLLIGNIPELVKGVQQRLLGLPLFNILIGAALVLYFLGIVVSKLVFFPLTILLLLAALPLAINRAGATRAYLNGARTVATRIGGVISRRPRTF